MVLIYLGSSEHIKHVSKIEKKKIDFDDAIDVTKCLQQIEIPD